MIATQMAHLRNTVLAKREVLVEWKRNEITDIRLDVEGNVRIQSIDGKQRRIIIGRPKEMSRKIAETLASEVLSSNASPHVNTVRLSG
jgi:hypothetical protein